MKQSSCIIMLNDSYNLYLSKFLHGRNANKKPRCHCFVVNFTETDTYNEKNRLVTISASEFWGPTSVV